MLTAIMKEVFSYKGIVTEMVKAMGVKLPARELRSGLLGPSSIKTNFTLLPSASGDGKVQSLPS